MSPHSLGFCKGVTFRSGLPRRMKRFSTVHSNANKTVIDTNYTSVLSSFVLPKIASGPLPAISALPVSPLSACHPLSLFSPARRQAPLCRQALAKFFPCRTFEERAANSFRMRSSTTCESFLSLTPLKSTQPATAPSAKSFRMRSSVVFTRNSFRMRSCKKTQGEGVLLLIKHPMKSACSEESSRVRNLSSLRVAQPLLAVLFYPSPITSHCHPACPDALISVTSALSVISVLNSSLFDFQLSTVNLPHRLSSLRSLHSTYLNRTRTLP